jgi:hypothetical protein
MNQPIKIRDIRIWALLLTAIFGVIGVIQFLIWHHERAAAIFWILAVGLLVPGLFVPVILTPVYRLWLKFAAALAWFNTRLILGLTYFLVFTPIGILLKLLRKDLISEKWDTQATSYWIERKKVPFDRSRYEKQY